MDFKLKNKIIYIISPDRWGTMHVSKHNYAIELSERGNKVFFINPANRHAKKRIEINSVEHYNNLFCVTYRPIYKGKRFLPSVIYNFLLVLQIKKIKKVTGFRPDVVWSFLGFHFNNLKYFKALISIFHPVDFFTVPVLPQEAYSADLCLSSAPALSVLLNKSCKPSFFIHHGLNKMFQQQAEHSVKQSLLSGNIKSKVLTVGYVGNLLMQAPDRVTMRLVIEQNPDTKFIFWGQYDKSVSNLMHFDTQEVYAFIEFLKSAHNVTLRGPHPSHILKDEMQVADLFWICWNLIDEPIWNSGTNPHKIIEYLSTGKPVVSHYISIYEDTGLLYMLAQNNNNDYLKLFSDVMEIIKNGEPAEKRLKRIDFALDNTYAKQVNRIEVLINEHVIASK